MTNEQPDFQSMAHAIVENHNRPVDFVGLSREEALTRIRECIPLHSRLMRRFYEVIDFNEAVTEPAVLTAFYATNCGRPPIINTRAVLLSFMVRCELRDIFPTLEAVNFAETVSTEYGNLIAALAQGTHPRALPRDMVNSFTTTLARYLTEMYDNNMRNSRTSAAFLVSTIRNLVNSREGLWYDHPNAIHINEQLTIMCDRLLRNRQPVPPPGLNLEERIAFIMDNQDELIEYVPRN